MLQSIEQLLPFTDLNKTYQAGMNDQLLTFYELILIIRQELIESHVELTDQLFNNQVNTHSILDLALKQQRLTILLKVMVRELLCSEPGILDDFDNRIFDSTLGEVLRQAGVERPVN